ncbi:MAG TPA: GAF domain-containing SpoIIE family protein phosphatase [Solirubrobacteraceae bacterium]|nr:GAF domain-containing SpoIIE family protein phosphatase [Solirubrobacteraceae bacterium]
MGSTEHPGRLGALAAAALDRSVRRAAWLRRRLGGHPDASARGERNGEPRTHQLLRITDAALGSLPLDELLVEVLRRVCEALPGDAAALLLVDSPLGTPVLRAAYGFDPGEEEGTLLPGVGLAARVVEEGRPVSLLDAEVGGGVRLTALRHMGAVAGAPLLVGSRVIGVLEVGRQAAVAHDAQDLELLQLAADRTAMAVEHGRVFERERHIAQTLQRSLLLTRLPEIPGAELETRFLPAGAGQEIGGDFYDVIALEGDRWLLVIGDVCGKGPEAAALTSMVRYTLRGHAPHEPRPGELLGLLNDAMLSQRPHFLFCTLACVLVEPAGRYRMLTIAGGGHPMPLIVRGDRHVEVSMDHDGPLVGVWEDVDFPERRYRLSPGDMLVAYTDGLLEAHAPDRILAPPDLADLAAGCARQPLPSFLRALESAALGDSVEPVRDDIAILALAVTRTPSGRAQSPCDPATSD